MCVALDIPLVRYVPKGTRYKDLYHIELSKANISNFVKQNISNKLACISTLKCGVRFANEINPLRIYEIF